MIPAYGRVKPRALFSQPADLKCTLTHSSLAQVEISRIFCTTLYTDVMVPLLRMLTLPFHKNLGGEREDRDGKKKS